MQLQQAEFIKDKLALLAKLIMRGGDGVDCHSCVITDLDIFFEHGCTLEQMHHCQLITDIDSLIAKIKDCQSSISTKKYGQGKLIKMVDEIFLRWEANTLKNQPLEKWIDSRLKDEIMNYWQTSDATTTCHPKTGILGEISNHLNIIVLEIVERYANNEPKLTDNFDYLDDLVSKKLYHDFITGKLSDVFLVRNIIDQAEKLFLSLLSKKQLPQPIEEDIHEKWLKGINTKYQGKVPSLASYCWELTLDEAKKSALCIRNMDDLIKNSFRKIIEDWRNNKLPKETPSINRHLELYLCTYLSQIIRKGSETGSKIYLGAISSIVKEKMTCARSYMAEVAKLILMDDAFKKSMSKQSTDAIAANNFINNLVIAYRVNNCTKYAGEFRDIICNIIKPSILNQNSSTSNLTTNEQIACATEIANRSVFENRYCQFKPQHLNKQKDSAMAETVLSGMETISTHETKLA